MYYSWIQRYFFYVVLKLRTFSLNSHVKCSNRQQEENNYELQLY